MDDAAGFACLASQYVAELSCGRTPCIETVVTSAAHQVNDHLLSDCAALYSQLIHKEVAGKLPVDTDDQLKAHNEYSDFVIALIMHLFI